MGHAFAGTCREIEPPARLVFTTASPSGAESTSSGLPMFPSTTVALRSSPRSFARFIGELLKARLSASCVLVRISGAIRGLPGAAA